MLFPNNISWDGEEKIYLHKGDPCVESGIAYSKYILRSSELVLNQQQCPRSIDLNGPA